MAVAVVAVPFVITGTRPEEADALTCTDVLTNVLSGAVVGKVRVSTWLAFDTLSVAVAVEAAYPPEAAWDTVIVEVPAPVIVMVLSLMVATPELLLVKANAPELADPGFAIVKAGSP